MLPPVIWWLWTMPGVSAWPPSGTRSLATRWCDDSIASSGFCSLWLTICCAISRDTPGAWNVTMRPTQSVERRRGDLRQRAAEAVARRDHLAVRRRGPHLALDQRAVRVELVHADAARIDVGDQRVDLARHRAAERDDRRPAALRRHERAHHELVLAADDRQRPVALRGEVLLVLVVELLVDHAVGELLDRGVGDRRGVIGLRLRGLGSLDLGALLLAGQGLEAGNGGDRLDGRLALDRGLRFVDGGLLEGVIVLLGACLL